jgi:hypothetical protein
MTFPAHLIAVLALVLSGCAAENISNCANNPRAAAEIQDQLKTEDDLKRWKEIKEASGDSVVQLETAENTFVGVSCGP